MSAAQGVATTVNYTLAPSAGGTPSATVIGTDTGAATVSGGVVSAQTATGGTITFAPGTTSATITLPITFDTVVETGKGVLVSLSAPTIATGTAPILSATAATATTLTPDAPAPSFTVTSNAVSGVATQEGSTVTYTITPTGVTDKAYSLTLSTVGDTIGGIATAATASAFSPASTTVSFAAGTSVAQTVVETIVDNGVIDGLRGYKTSLIQGTTAVSSVTGLITDPATTLALTADKTSVDEGSSVTYTVTASRAAPAGGVTIPVTLNGTSTFGVDYTGPATATSNIVIAAGATTGTLVLAVVADNITEGSETIRPVRLEFLIVTMSIK